MAGNIRENSRNVYTEEIKNPVQRIGIEKYGSGNPQHDDKGNCLVFQQAHDGKGQSQHKQQGR